MRIRAQVIVIFVPIWIRILISIEVFSKLKRKLHGNKRKTFIYFHDEN